MDDGGLTLTDGCVNSIQTINATTETRFSIFSERANNSSFESDYDKDRLKEGANINRSLVTLGNVIKSLGKLKN